MAHELWLGKSQNFIRLTPIAGNIQWRTNLDELGGEMSFDIAIGDNLPKNPINIGDLVVLRHKEELFRGVIIDENRNNDSPVVYTAFDYAFYLNKSNATYQFKKMTADKCIRKILSDFNVPIGNIPKMNTQIDKIFNDMVVSEIIKEILEMARQKSGTRYDMEMRAGKLYIEKRGNRKIKSLIDMYGKTYDNTLAISNPSRSRSIADMKNAIQIIGNDDKVVYSTQDRSMINKYGRLQTVVTLDQDEKRSAKQVAENELRQLSKVTEETSIELIGNNRVRANRILEIEEPITGLKGDYLVTSATHNLSGGLYTMSLDLEAT